MPKCVRFQLQSNFIEITLRHGCSPVNLLHIFRKHFLRIYMECFVILMQKMTALGSVMK